MFHYVFSRLIGPTNEIDFILFPYLSLSLYLLISENEEQQKKSNKVKIQANIIDHFYSLLSFLTASIPFIFNSIKWIPIMHAIIRIDNFFRLCVAFRMLITINCGASLIGEISLIFLLFVRRRYTTQNAKEISTRFQLLNLYRKMCVFLHFEQVSE